MRVRFSGLVQAGRQARRLLLGYQMEVCVCPLCSGKLPLHVSRCLSCGAEFKVSRKGYCPGCLDIVDLDRNNACGRCGALSPGCLFELRLARGAGAEHRASRGGRARGRILKVFPHLDTGGGDPARAAGRQWLPFRPSSRSRGGRAARRAALFALLLLGLFLACSLAGLVADRRQHSRAGQLKRMRSPDAAVRMDVARELSEKRAPESVAALLSLMEDPEPAVRIYAMRKLGELGAGAAAPHVTAMLESRNEQEVRQAVITAGRLREPSAVGPLIDLLEEDRMVALVEEALVMIGRPAVGALAEGHHCRALAVMERRSPGSTEPLPSYLEQGDLERVSRWFEYYIYLGRTGSEGVLVEALEEYGGRMMAQAYAGSGNAVLAEAGGRWLRQRGYGSAGAPGAPAGAAGGTRGE